MSEIKVCVAYRHQGETIREMPADLAVLEACEPVYETLPGWSEGTKGIRDFGRLPKAAQRYVERLSELVDGEIGIVSTGPEREETILRPQSAVGAWFA